MIQVNYILLFVFILIFLQKFSLIQSDLPIHCLKHDVNLIIIKIIGTWMISATALFKVVSNHEMKCGHDEPSREETSNLAMPTLEFR
jgi:hypothetical protein